MGVLLLTLLRTSSFEGWKVGHERRWIEGWRQEMIVMVFRLCFHVLGPASNTPVS